ncbi:uncharacterized protein YndB with AHSA1/START domain [Cytobacillus firmus]|uniref:Uncharacterized protein YndB with AHSA1/START domain n=2 Tax=Cytobacillus TaxID=2675230 RepID=A0A366JYX7_CYTFI|nr:uncharacterized protein YndB with AHSA1/START domain [Cytobacillus firmus]TDX43481.1 uncharacterized protein YndB with AHSA1/START domain [Cytobacillus oceanisediminis]
MQDSISKCNNIVSGGDRLEPKQLNKQNENTNRGREITVTRVFDAPVELVFDSWTKEDHLSKWWGPQGFTLTFQTFDMKPGGTWQFIMHGPDGVDFPNTNVFVEVVKLEQIVFKHDVYPHFLATAAFEDLDGKTKLTYTTIFEETSAVFKR